jgi:hypothetical protein
LRVHVPFPYSLNYSTIFETTPAPTVRPPSRIAKRRPSFHRDRRDQLTSIDMLSPGMTISVPPAASPPGNVRRAEVKLRAVVREERRVTAAFFLRQNVGFSRELRVRLDRARLAQNLAALDFFALGAAQQRADIVARLTADPGACGTSRRPSRRLLRRA